MPLNEIAASLYAWDLADEGLDRPLDNLQGFAGVNSAYLVGLMHKEKRPLHARFYPHNPVRKYYLPEDSRVYWQPDTSLYTGRLTPLGSEREFLRGVDWLDRLTEAARSRGMKTGCEISHTILDAGLLQEQYSDVLQRDVFGDLVGPFGTSQAANALPCLNNPDIQEYLVALVTDLARNHDIDYIQTCLVMFSSGFSGNNTISSSAESAGWTSLLQTATGGCFCAACEAKAKGLGLDWNAMVSETRHIARMTRGTYLEEAHEGALLRESNYSETEMLLENEAFTAWLMFRRHSVDDLFRVVSEAIHSANASIDFRYNTYMSQPELAGLNFASAFTFVDSVRESDYSDQLGTAEGVAVKRAKLMKARRALPVEKPLIAALGVRPNATPETLRASVKAATEAGCDGLSLGHYDGATMERLRAVTEGMREWEGAESDWVFAPED